MAFAYRPDRREARSPREWRSLVLSQAADLPEALDSCEAAMRQWPQQAELHELKGELLARLSRASDAETALQAALALDPTRAKPALRLARLRLEQGRPSEVVPILEANLAAGAKPERLYRDGGLLLLELGDYERAAKWLALAMSVGGPRPEELLKPLQAAIWGLADDADQGVSPELKRFYSEAVERLAQGSPAAAEPLFAKLTRASPGYVQGWLGWRGALEAGGKHAALADLRRAWSVFSPRTKPTIGWAMDRRLGPRGLVVDPREPIPVRPAREVLEAVASPEDLIAAGDAMLTLDPGGAPVELPPLVRLRGQTREAPRFAFTSAPKFMVGIEGAALVGRGLPLTREGVLVEELRPNCDLAKAGLRRVGGQLRFAPDELRDGLCPVRIFDTPALLMAGPTDGGFGDWMLNFPPRLAIAEAIGLDCPVVVRLGRPAAWLDLLVALGVKRSRILFHDPSGVSLFPKLYVPSWPLPRRGQPMADLFGIYRDRLPRSGAPGGERLYLSREGVDARKLVNEAQVRASFERRGFRVVQPEHLDFEATRALFAGAAVVAGPYGSAFMNVAFADRPPLGLALMPPKATGFLEELALWLGGCQARFGCLFGEPAPTGSGQWIAPIDQVEAALDDLLPQAERR